jgi:hypothetical protein
MVLIKSKLDTGLTPLHLPLDLNEIGSRYTLDSNPAARVVGRRGIDLLEVWNECVIGLTSSGTRSHMSYKDGHSLDVTTRPVFQLWNASTQEEIMDRIIKVDGITYSIEMALPVNSVFGRMFVIKALDGENADTQYILKVCKAHDDRAKKGTIAEALTQHIIYMSTHTNNHYDCSYALQIQKMFRLSFYDIHSSNIGNYGYGEWTECLGIIMERGDPWNCVDDKLLEATEYLRGSMLSKYLVKLSRTLHNLQVTYRFAHGDLHAQNTFYKDDVVKLIDFGKSSLTIDGLTLNGPEDPAGASSNPPARYWKPYDILYFLAYCINARRIVFNDAVINNTMGSKIYNALLKITQHIGLTRETALHWNVGKLLTLNEIDRVTYNIQNTLAELRSDFDVYGIPSKVINTLNNYPDGDARLITNQGDWCRVPSVEELAARRVAAEAAFEAARQRAAEIQVLHNAQVARHQMAAQARALNLAQVGAQIVNVAQVAAAHHQPVLNVHEPIPGYGGLKQINLLVADGAKGVIKMVGNLFANKPNPQPRPAELHQVIVGSELRGNNLVGGTRMRLTKKMSRTDRNVKRQSLSRNRTRRAIKRNRKKFIK